MIQRNPLPVNDTNHGKNGTPITREWWIQQCDMIDARWSGTVSPLGGGAIHNVAFGESDSLILPCNAGTSTEITGIVAPAGPIKPYKPLRLFQPGDGVLLLPHNDARSLAANRFYNNVISTATPLCKGGAASYVYDPALGWRLLTHQQGVWLPYVPTWKSTGTQPAIGNGSLTGRYQINGHVCHFSLTLNMGSTTTYGDGFWYWSTPHASAQVGFTVNTANAAGSGQLPGTSYFFSATEFFAIVPAGLVGPTIPVVFSANAYVQVRGSYELP